MNDAPALLDDPLAERLGGDRIEWCSPLRSDEFAEYRDADFLRLLGLKDHGPALADFWPGRGPRWDALGVTD